MQSKKINHREHQSPSDKSEYALAGKEHREKIKDKKKTVLSEKLADWTSRNPPTG